MSEVPTPQPLLVDPAGRGLFAVYHATQRPPLAAVLICPPFLHEHSRSYRLFALLGHALAERGVAVLRFDYHGTGDSAGSDTAFSLKDAANDASLAVTALRKNTGSAPLIVMGVRAGAFPALPVAQATNAREVWLWQPVTDGSAYLTELRRLDQAQRTSQDRYLHRDRRAIHNDDGTLVGFPCSPDFISELENARLAPADQPAIPISVIDIDARTSPRQGARCINLANELGDWIDEIDIGRFLAPLVHDLAARLVATAVGVD